MANGYEKQRKRGRHRKTWNNKIANVIKKMEFNRIQIMREAMNRKG